MVPVGGQTPQVPSGSTRTMHDEFDVNTRETRWDQSTDTKASVGLTDDLADPESGKAGEKRKQAMSGPILVRRRDLAKPCLIAREENHRAVARPSQAIFTLIATSLGFTLFIVGPVFIVGQYSGCAYSCCQSRATIFAIRPRMCEARCGTATQGKIKNRVLYASRCRLRLRASTLQPMKRSRPAKCRGAEHHARHAIAWPWADTKYFRCSPTGCR